MEVAPRPGLDRSPDSGIGRDHVGDRLRERAERRDRALARLDVAGVGEQREDDQPAVLLRGRNGIGGAGMTLAIVESSSGAASASAMKP